jgi:hypothetical protein
MRSVKNNVVILPKGTKVTFPNKCVVCQELSLEQQVYKTYRSGGIKLFYALILRKTFKTKIPIHQSCMKHLNSQRRLRLLIYSILVFVAMLIGFYFALNFLAFLGISLLIVVLIFIWEERHPLQFEISVDNSLIHYKFLNNLYANEFYKLNSFGENSKT